MKKIAIISLCACLGGCNSSPEPAQDSPAATTERVPPAPAAGREGTVAIAYDDLEEFGGEDSRYRFKAPRNLFEKTGESEYRSRLLDASITLILHETDRFDETGYFRKEDLVNEYRSGIGDIYLVDKGDWFVISGKNAGGDIIYLKGFYSEMVSMEGREEGEPAWLWSRSCVLRMEYPESRKAEFDRLIPVVMQSFRCEDTF